MHGDRRSRRRSADSTTRRWSTEATAGLDVDIIVADPDLPEGDPDDAAAVPSRHSTELRWLFYSSGTTADPKGAKHSDRSMSAANDGMQWSMEVSRDDKAAVVFPITHVGGLVWLFNTMQTGVELLMVETFNPADDTATGSAEHGCTCAGAGTVFWLAYLNAQRRLPDGERLLPDVRIFNGGGAPKPATLHAEMMAAFGAPLIGGWGMTEIADQHDGARRRSRRARRRDRRPAVPGCRAARRDGRARAAARARRASCGSRVRRCAWATSTARSTPTRSTRTAGSAPATSASSTRAAGSSITGRLKDIIIRKGENISAKEIEDLLHAHPAVADAAVIGLPDDRQRRAGVCRGRAAGQGEQLALGRDGDVPQASSSCRRTRSPSNSRSSRRSPATRPARCSRRTSARPIGGHTHEPVLRPARRRHRHRIGDRRATAELLRRARAPPSPASICRARTSTAAAITAAGGTATAIPCDVERCGGGDSAPSISAVDELGGIDIVCNIAGIGHFAWSHEETPEAFDRIVQRQPQRHVLRVAGRAAPPAVDGQGRHHQHRVERRPAGPPWSAAYCASKGGVVLTDEGAGLRVPREGRPGERRSHPGARTRTSSTRSRPCRRGGVQGDGEDHVADGAAPNRARSRPRSPTSPPTRRAT